MFSGFAPLYLVHRILTRKLKGRHESPEEKQERDAKLKMFGTLFLFESSQDVLRSVLDSFPWWQHVRFGIVIFLVLFKGGEKVWDEFLAPFMFRYRKELSAIQEEGTRIIQSNELGIIQRALNTSWQAIKMYWQRLLDDTPDPEHRHDQR